MQGKKEDKKAKRRREIVKAAWELFGEKGFDGTTIDDMTDRAGVSHGTFYLYFSSKEDILRYLGEEVQEEMLSGSRKIAAMEELSPQERLFRIVKYLLTVHEGQEFRMDLHDVIHRKIHDKLKDDAIELFLPLVTSLVEEGVEAGQMDISRPRETATYLVLLVAELEHSVDRWEGDEARKRASDALRELLIRTIGGDEHVFQEDFF